MQVSPTKIALSHGIEAPGENAGKQYTTYEGLNARYRMCMNGQISPSERPYKLAGLLHDIRRIVVTDDDETTKIAALATVVFNAWKKSAREWAVIPVGECLTPCGHDRDVHLWGKQ